MMTSRKQLYCARWWSGGGTQGRKEYLIPDQRGIHAKIPHEEFGYHKIQVDF
jgi:hypothetical protein